MAELNLPVIFGMFLVAIVAGTFGALLGLGGGIIVIPVLTILFHVPFREAIAASLVTVIATSTSAAVVYVEKHFANIRMGMILEIGTTIGGLVGGLTVVYLSTTVLQFLFAAMLIYTAVTMARKAGGEKGASDEVYVEVPADAPHAEMEAQIGNGLTPYKVERYPAGVAASVAAGWLSGVLGVGGGIIKVPVMRLVMGVPLRVAIATSNVMIGVTAATSALIYYVRGDINPMVTVPSALGVLLGAQIGTRLVRKINARVLTWVFIVMMAFTAVQMILRALKGGG